MEIFQKWCSNNIKDCLAKTTFPLSKGGGVYIWTMSSRETSNYLLTCVTVDPQVDNLLRIYEELHLTL